MNRVFGLGLTLVLALFMSACGGTQSAVEGKLVDWNGKPVAGAKVTAAQVQPLKGYEQFEAVTNSDGTFRVSGLFPSSLYVLKPSAEKWICETAVQVNSAPQGETAMLPSPIVIAQVFTRSHPPVVADIVTGAVAQVSVQGKLVDWNGKPVEGTKIIAVPRQPIKGHEQCEAVTASDGTFRLSSLLASSTYQLFPRSDKWTTKSEVSVNTPPHHADITGLQSPIVIDHVFTKSTPPVVADIATGADGKAIVQGKLVDWSGKPVGEIQIIAIPQESIKGHEECEALTASDGSFRLSDLLPSSTYKLVPRSDKWVTNTEASVNTQPHHGDVAGLESPMVIAQAFSRNGGSLVTDLTTGAALFTVSSEGVLTDSKTGLDWVVGPDRDTNYAQAEQWVAACKVAGGGWRMPTCEELKTLYQQGLGQRNMDPAFKTTGQWVWAEPRDSSTAWTCNFGYCIGNARDRDGSDSDRVFGVRSRPPARTPAQ